MERKTIVVTKSIADKLNAALNWREGEDPDLRFDEDETFIETAVFDDGYSMDIKVCGVQYEEGSCNSAWAEAVLFDSNGTELACTDCTDEFLGLWELEGYEVLVKTENKITSRMLLEGIKKGLVNFIEDPNLGGATVCKIGEYWFYFEGDDAASILPAEFLLRNDMGSVVYRLDDALNGLRDDGEYAEYDYYYSVLLEGGCCDCTE